MRDSPLYVRLAEAIRAEITEGRLKTGDRLPTEAELSRIHGVSRITVRQAFDVLREQGLIERFAGRGSFVTRGTGIGPWTINSIEDLVRLTAQTETQIIDWRPVRPPAEVAEFFRIASAQIYRLRGVRKRSRLPIHYVEIYTPAELGRCLARGELVHRTVLELIETQIGIPVAAAQEEIWAATADVILARRLGVRVRTAVLVQQLKFFGFDRRPLEWLQVRWRADQFRRRNEMRLASIRQTTA